MDLLRNLTYTGLLLACLGVLSACSEDTPSPPNAQPSPAQGQLELSTITVDGETPPGLFNDWLTMSRIATTMPSQEDTQWANLKVQNSATVTFTNIGVGPLKLTRLTLSPNAPFKLQRPILPLELAPGASYNLKVTFTEGGGQKGVRRAALNVKMDSEPFAATVQLAGLFMSEPEGNNEVTLQQIVEAFGYTTEIGLDKQGRLSEESSSALAGEEIRAKFWQRTNSDEPVYIRQLAAYHGCCNEEDFIRLVGQGGEPLGEFFHAASYGQSVLPLEAGEQGPASMTLTPSAPFEIVVGAVGDSYSTNASENLGVRLWPVKDQNKNVVPDAYIIAEDYVRSGCGENSANCDYQDNVFLITNVAPVR